MRCEECEHNKIEDKGKVYRCPNCGMTVCEACYEKLLHNCQFCAPPFEEINPRQAKH